MDISYKPTFIKRLNRLEPSLQEEVFEKIELFKDVDNHQLLKVHQLKGKLKGFYSFSVNYRYRIVFVYVTATEVDFIDIGDHSVYQ